MAAKSIPDGFTPLTPYLYVASTADAIAFYQKAFGATEVMRLTMPGGGIAHAEVEFFGAKVMFADENPEWGNKGPKSLGGTTAGCCLYVDDCDAVFAQAVAAGATVKMPVADQFYGDRSGSVTDPFGHVWTIATHQVDMTPAQMQAAMDEWMKSMPAAA